MADLSNSDKEFLEKLHQIVKENIPNESFGVSELAKALGMSRSNLHRKINSLTKISVSQFIRQERLKSAKKLLRQTSDTVSEVGYKVGFSSTSYFIKCFHDFYGYSPGQVGEREEEESNSTLVQNPKKKRIVILASVLSVIVLAVIITFILYKGYSGGKHKEIKSLLILPFDNLTGIDSMEHLISGLHYTLIDEIGKISELKVKSKRTADAYKDKNKSIPEIAAELQVDAVVESVISGLNMNNMSIQFKLFTPDENLLWDDRFDEDLSEVFNMSARLAKKFANELKIGLSPDEEQLLSETRTVNREAYEFFTKGMLYWDRLGKADLLKAREYFNIAHELDPNWADPYVGLAMVWGGLSQMGYEPASIANPKIKEYTQKALEIDPNSSLCHFKLATSAVWQDWNWEEGEKEFLKSIELKPSDAKNRIYYAHLLMILNREEEALFQANLALELDPLDPLILGLYAVVLKDASKYELAIMHCEKGLSIDPDHPFTKHALRMVYYNQGKFEKWFEIWKQQTGWNDEITASIDKVFHENGFIAAIKEMIKISEKAVKEGTLISYYLLADRYFRIENDEKAMDCLEKSYELRSPSIPYVINFSDLYPRIKKNKRYIELLKKMNLPLPTTD